MDYAPLLPGGEEGHMEAETLSVCTGLLRHGRMPWWQRLRRHLIRRLVLLPGIARCDLFSAPVPEEFAVLRAAIPGYLRAAYAQIDYASVEHSFAPGSCSVRGCDILVGNSATPSNNHLDAFRLLAACPLAGRRVLVPLSYGDSQYREVVLRQGHSLFGSAFEPILDFMPLASYNERLSTCGVAIMYHRRQQALGNVGSLLFGGCKVLFHPESPVLATLRRDGAVVDSTEQLRSDPHAALMPLDADAVACNQAVIKSRWGAAVVAEHLRELILAVRHIQEARCTASRI
jgi:hypothetical protein